MHFGAGQDALSLSSEALALPNRLGDTGISRFLEARLEAELEAFGAEESLEALVRGAVSRSLSEGVPRMSDVARRLAMSERTLHRKLRARGASFRALVDATRRELAQGLLRLDGYTTSEVAFLSGFSEQSAFQRAFKRWTGRTPVEFRRAERARGTARTDDSRR